METDQLIRTLAADNAHRARPVGFVLALALLAAAPVSLVMFFAALGVRPDVMTAMHNPFFDLKFAGDAGAGDLGHRGQPASVAAGSRRCAAGRWLLLIPVGLLAVGIAGEMMMPQRLPMMTRLVGHNSRVCMTAIPLLSLPLLAAALIGLRHGAPARPALAGAHRRTVVGRTGGDALRRRTAPTIRRCSWRPGTRSPPRWSPRSARWRDRGCCGSRRTFVEDGRAGLIAAHAAGAAVCCMRWKRSTCCAVEGRSRS